MTDRRQSVGCSILAVALAAPFALVAANGAPVVAALYRPADKVTQPDRAVLLAASRAGKCIVAVGERGIVLVSSDGGASWKQSVTPVSVTLTGVHFADDKRGVAVGHAGVVLVTADGGATWTPSLDGARAAELALEAANALPDDQVNKATFVADAERLVADGPDKPFLDLLVDGQRVVVVGAYGLIFASEDGGKTWVSWMDRIDNPRGNYLYAIRKRGDTLLLAGEQGFLARSDDNGATFKQLESPYAGSWFTAEFAGESEIVLAGLRGNVFRSVDDGANWTSLDGANGASITAVASAEGRLLLASQAGQLLQLRGDALVALNSELLPPINGVQVAGDRILALTVQGIVSMDASKEPQ